MAHGAQGRGRVVVRERAQAGVEKVDQVGDVRGQRDCLLFDGGDVGRPVPVGAGQVRIVQVVLVGETCQSIG
ncbi:hypothetical protein ACWD0A_29320 [Streptomyces sp. NPDC002867]